MMFSIKRDINITHVSLHILTLTIEFDNPEKCKHMTSPLILDYHKGKPSSRQCENRFPAHHKKLEKKSPQIVVIPLRPQNTI